MGNFTRDIELRHTQSGKAVTTVGLAINEWKPSGEETYFFDVEIWDKTAEFAKEKLGKGSSVFVEGRLKQDTWETEDGKRTKTIVVCDKLIAVGKPRERTEADVDCEKSNGNNGNDVNTKVKSIKVDDTKTDNTNNDEVPF